jgi:PII-like signaling protein
MLLRVLIGEDVRSYHRPLHEANAIRALEVHLAVATVLRCPMGLGHSSRLLTTKTLRLSSNLPLVIEFFDEPPTAEAAIHLLEAMVAQGHIVSWPAHRHGAAVPVPQS